MPGLPSIVKLTPSSWRGSWPSTISAASQERLLWADSIPFMGPTRGGSGIGRLAASLLGDPQAAGMVEPWAPRLQRVTLCR